MTFVKGISGNTAGRPKEAEHVRATKEAIRELLPTAAKELAKFLESRYFSQKRWAIEQILNYGLGKPPQSVTVGEEEGTALAAVLQIVQRAAIANNNHAKLDSPDS